MGNKDYKAIFEALNEQGWRVEKGSNSFHFTAFPPDTGKQMVVFATGSNNRRAIQNAIRDLKASGLQWPWTPPRKTNGKTVENLPEPVELPKPSELPPVDAKQIANLDDIFVQLKDARHLSELTEQALSMLLKKAAELELEVADAKELRSAAMVEFKQVKQKFDDAFTVSDV